MENGALLAISPAEGIAPYPGVSWRCFKEGMWERDVERALRRLLRTGDVAYDIGANFGYFSAVMAQAVGPTGLVVAFEPVPETFQRLALIRELNAFPQLVPLQVALGDADGHVEMLYNSSLSGDASVHNRPNGVQPKSVDVLVHRLDEFISSHQLPPPSLLKVDVEGHELAVFEGATQTLVEHRPALLFELNASMSRQAGWNASDMSALLQNAAPYKFFLLGSDDPLPIELPSLELDEGTYLDVLAVA